MNLTEAVAFALTGDRLDLPDEAEPGGTAQLIAELARAGWEAGRIRAHADLCRQDGTPWPHPVAASQRPGIGAAQLSAALAAALDDLGLRGPARPPAPPRPLTADERRLLAEVPPHHGT
ncbi:MAG: hypothetical protein HZY73_03340 [Micropruina sp.]|nr:MAG: hypothetical protein HZY73_03340 [Micropruina sp.]